MTLSPEDMRALKIEVNEYCAQTGSKEARLGDLMDLLFMIDTDLADRILASRLDEDTILRPGPVGL